MVGRQHRVRPSVATLPVVLLAIGCLPVLAIILIGLLWLITAHTPDIKRISGVVATATDLSSHGEYDRTEISLVASSTTYNFRRDALHPAVAPDQPLPGDLIVLWVDPSFNWSHLGTTEVLAASLAADESPTRPAHTTRHFDVPSSQERDSRLAGALMLGIGGLVIGLAALYEWLTERAQRGRPPSARSPGGGRAQARYLGSRPQPSGDR